VKTSSFIAETMATGANYALIFWTISFQSGRGISVNVFPLGN